MKCDGIRHCDDSSDEIGCNCAEDEFICQCYKHNPPSCAFHSACIPSERYHDGRWDCTDGSDETPFVSNVQCGDCDVTLRRLNNISECNKTGLTLCDNSTCYKTRSLDFNGNSNKSDVICASYCSNTSSSCQIPFQCSDGSLILASQFCNNVSDCPDHSDETVDQPGFKCNNSSLTCVLPQINLYDNLAQCDNGRDLCHGNDCVECLDKRLLISLSQVCDGEFDCYDLSDECFCLSRFDTFNVHSDCIKFFLSDKNFPPKAICSYNLFTAEISNHESHYSNYCQTKHGIIEPSVCDDRPECSDYSDECNCKYPPSFCTDECHSFFPMGDRYCDGIEDPAWMLINSSACPQGFDEKYCPKRFYCKVDAKVNIDISQKCDGVVDCDDGSDEALCIPKRIIEISYEVIISNPICFGVLFVIGIIIVIANLLCIAFIIKPLRDKRLAVSIWTQHLILLNISIADLIMGIQILAFFGFMTRFLSNDITIKWFSSLNCSLVGSLSVISSEASCLLLVILTAFRLKTVSNPIASLTISTLPWKISICLAWVVAFLLGLLPLMNFRYFMSKGFDFCFHSMVNRTQISFREQIKLFCLYAIVTNQSVDIFNDLWQFKPFSYYSESAYCTPSPIFDKSFTAWEYRMALHLINFLSFMFIAVGYVIMFVFFRKKRMLNTNNKLLSKQEATMRKRIARIIATDFCCWVPMSILVFVILNATSTIRIQFALVQISYVTITINSALNPFLYSSLPDILLRKVCCFFKRKNFS